MQQRQDDGQPGNRSEHAVRNPPSSSRLVGLTIQQGPDAVSAGRDRDAPTSTLQPGTRSSRHAKRRAFAAAALLAINARDQTDMEIAPCGR
jgi:hypothetical protein